MSVRAVLFYCTLSLFLLAACAKAYAEGPSALATVTPTTSMETQSAEEWRQDLAYLAEQLRTRHPNPFYKTPETEFERAVNELDREIPTLTRDEIVAGLIRIAAMIDGHTQIRFWEEPVNFHIYPLRLYEFSDGLFVIDAMDSYSNVVGARLVKIGDTPIEDAYPRISMYVHRDNASTVKLLTPPFLMMPEVLMAEEMIRDANLPRLTFENANGEALTANPKPVTMDEFLAALPGTRFTGLPERDAPLMQARRNEIFWSEFLTPTKTLYIQYNQVRSTSNGKQLYEFAQELGELVENQDVERVVVDMRHNGGGDNTTYFPMLNLLVENEEINQPGKLFLITGRQTFSAAANFSTDVEQKTNALFAGEPMGGSPNLYGDTTQYTLPNSKLDVHISRRTWIKSKPDDPRQTIEPHIPVELASTDYFDERDPVLDAILEYTPRASGAISPTRVISFTTSDGAVLDGTVYGNGATAVIFSNMGAHRQDTWTEMAERVAARGYMALTYDNRYWGNGTGIDDSLRSRVPDDLRAAVQYMRAQGAQRVVLVGASLGGMASARIAADMNPAAVVIMAAPVDRTNLPFLLRSDDIRAIASAKLFLVAENDELGFTDDVNKMYEIANAPKVLELFGGREHGTDVFKTDGGEKVMNSILEFLETHVKLVHP